MKCHILFSGKNKKSISKCRLLKILPRVLSVKECKTYVKRPCGQKYESYNATIPISKNQLS